jgi:NADPH-dependent curcumin reductase CurA
MTDWVKTGRIRYPEVIVDGLESAPAAFAGIFRSNSNLGKLLVRVSTV